MCNNIMNKILKEFGLQDDDAKDSLLHNLHKVPKKDKGDNMPHFQYPEVGQIVQADILYMPNDKGYKYMLVVVDNGSRLIDAEPMKTHDSAATVEAFRDIFKRHNVRMPKYKIEVDAGTEFKGDTLVYFKNNGVKIRVAPTGRHRMQGLVEKANQTIGTILHKRMTAQELLTGSVSKHWVKDLPKLIVMTGAKLLILIISLQTLKRTGLSTNFGQKRRKLNLALLKLRKILS